jgi:hemoglobin
MATMVGIRDSGFGIRAVSLGLLLALAPVGAMAQQAAPAPSPVTAPQPAVDAEALDVPEADAVEDAAAAPAEAGGVATPGQGAAAAARPTPGAMDPAPADAALLPVFKQFGEEAGLVALMDDFMVRLVADPRTHAFFAEADQAKIKKHLVEQFCVILGGPCTYTGRDMRASHQGFDIDRAAFNALVEDLQLAMDARRIPFRAQNQLLAKLAPMHRDIEHR